MADVMIPNLDTPLINYDVDPRLRFGQQHDAADGGAGADAFKGRVPPTALDLSGAADVAKFIQGIPHGPVFMLKGFRANHPFVPVKSWPATVRSVNCDAVTAVDVIVPDAAILVEFTKSVAGNVYLSNRRVALMPANWAAQGAQGFESVGAEIVINPTGIFYCYGQRSFSVIGDAAAVLSCAFYAQEDTDPIVAG